MEYPSLLTVKDLTIYKSAGNQLSPLVDNINFTINKGERLGIIGPSGSGKSLTLKAILGILPENLSLKDTSSIHIKIEKKFNKNISLIPQNPQINLNPLITIGQQLYESIQVIDSHSNNKKRVAHCKKWLERVGFQNPDRIYLSYPHELSGGQLQRVIIAIALCQKPALILADEPTTALDPILQNQILNLLFNLADDLQAGVIIISHDISIISKWTNKFIYLNEGKQIKGYHSLNSNDLIRKNQKNSEEVLLEVKNLTIKYKKGWLRPTFFNALDNISFTVNKGERLGIIGISGSGKSSLAKAICGLITPHDGQIVYTHSGQRGQLIFQNPFLSLNPKFNIYKTLNEALKSKKGTKDYRNDKILKMLSLVGLNDSFLDKFPHECSGGEQQRIAIARAISISPELLILDESLASLDADRQISILNLLIDIQNKTNISILFISHDIKRVAELCERIIILSNGRIIASGNTSELLNSKPLENLLI